MKKMFLSFVIMVVLSATGLSVVAAPARVSYRGDYYAVGVDAFQKGLYDKAQKSFECAVRINPKNVNARYYLAQVYIRQNKVSDAINQYERIIFLAPSSDAATLSQKGLSLIAQAKGKRVQMSQDDFAKYADNYLNYILTADGQTVKWSKFPVTVYIEPKEKRSVVQSAFAKWQEQSKGLVSFNYVNSAQNAQIKVQFTDKIDKQATGESYTAGFEKPYFANGFMIKSEIHILTVSPDTGQKLDDNKIFGASLHEIGHSLGFLAHSPNPDDVMTAVSENSRTSLSQRDLNTLFLLYKIDKKTLASRHVNETGVQLQQALDYVKRTPDKAIGWNNLGDIYRGKKMYADAIKSYKKGIQLEPENANSYNSLGTTYSMMMDYQNSFLNYKKACDLDKTNSFYLYQFSQICLKIGRKPVAKSYLDSYIKTNPEALSDDNIKNILKQFK